MRLNRYLKEEFIRLGIDDGPVLENEDEEPLTKRQVLDIKEIVIRRLVDLIDASGRASNPNKLTHDLMNREKKATMAVGQGVVIPHVRTMQAREMAMAIGISARGIPWGASDGVPARIFVAVVAPPYDDKTYLQVYKRLGELFVYENASEVILDATHPGEIIRFLNGAS